MFFLLNIVINVHESWRRSVHAAEYRQKKEKPMFGLFAGLALRNKNSQPADLRGLK